MTEEKLEQCRCDPTSWQTKPPKICSNPTACENETGWCKNCMHDLACHTNEQGELNESD